MGLISRVSSRTYRYIPKNVSSISINPLRAQSTGTGMNFSFATPVVGHYSNATNVTQVDLPTGTGTIGILPNHVPSLGVLAPGWATVYESEGAQKKYFVSSGSYTINADGSVTIAAEEAVPENDIDLDLARKELSNCQSQMGSASEEAKAELQIAVETLESMLR